MQAFARNIVDTVHHPLLDLKLLRIDGHEILYRVRANSRTRRSPILTSSWEEEDRFKEYDWGTTSYIHKPFNFEPFLGAIRQLLERWLFLTEAPSRKV